MTSPISIDDPRTKCLDTFLEGIYQFIKRAGFICAEVGRDEGPAVLAAREFATLLIHLCEDVDFAFDKKRELLAHLDPLHVTQIQNSCRKLRSVLKETVNGCVLEGWQAAAHVGLLEILFTDEGFERAGGNKGLSELCDLEHAKLQSAILEFHEELKIVEQTLPGVTDVLKKLHYDVNRAPHMV